MRKLRILACILMVALATTGLLAGCTPPPASGPVDLGITPLQDLTDYGHPSAPQYYHPAPFSYTTGSYNGTPCTDQITKLNARIATEKKTFVADQGKESTQSTYQKIFAHATADGVLTALAYATLPQAQMIGLVDYLTQDGADNFFEQYKKLDEYDDIMTANPNEGATATVYQQAYKDQQRLRRKMLQRLDSMGISGDQAGRTIIQASVYAEAVVKDSMIPIYLPGKTMDEYFKTLEKNGGLFDYDTLVFFKTNAHVRGNAVDANHHTTNDAKLVRAFGYSYDYQMAANKALTDADFEKELVYHFMSSLSDNDALEFARIKRENYTKGYRYKDTFYSNSFYPALNELEKVQEPVEAEVYGINESALGTGTQTVVGDGVHAEAAINIILGNTANPLGSAAERQLKGIKYAIKDDMLASDLEHYYFNTDEVNAAHTTTMAAKQRAYDAANKSSAPAWAPAQLQLELENLRMSQFILDEFIARGNKAGLSKCMVGQIYAVAADDIKTVNRLKKEIVVQIAELGKYVDGTAEYWGAVTAIGRKNAQLQQFVAVAANAVSKIDQQIGAANTQADWDNIKVELKAALDYNYGKLPVTSGTDTPQLNRLQYQLVKRYWNDGAKTPYIPGETTPTKTLDSTEVTFDTEHRISRLLNNHDAVVYHTAGLIRITFQKVDTFAGGNIGYKDWKIVEVESGKTLADKAKNNTVYPETSPSGDLVRGPLPTTADKVGGVYYTTFEGWYLDKAGYYKIDYNEAIELADPIYYAIFKKVVKA